MPKCQDKSRQVTPDPHRVEKRAMMYPVYEREVGEGVKMTAQEHSMRLNDGTTSPYMDSLSFDRVTRTEMGNLNDNK